MIALLAIFLSLSVAIGQDAPPDAPVVEELPPLLVEPQLLEYVEPTYAQAALDAGVEGSVLVYIEIDPTGAVSLAEVVTGLGYGLDEAALEAARRLRFSPARDETGPVSVGLEFAFGFTLDVGAVEGAEAVDDAVPEEAPAPVTLEGTVQERGSGRLLPAMSVLVVETSQTATTDAEGAFSFRGVPPGSYRVIVSRPGYQDLETTLEIVAGEVTVAALWIKPEGFGAEAVGLYERPKEEITRRTITVEEVRRIPGTFGDPVRVIQNLPGAARSPFGTGVLIIRGQNPEDSAVYVDGIRIPFIYHLGGYVSVLNSDLVETVDYLPGGYGVQYGRSLGGVVDVTTRKEAPEQSRLVWSTDVLDSGGLFEGRLGAKDQHHVGIAARRSYVDLFIPLLLRNTEFVARPRWWDYQVRYHHAGDVWDFTALWFGFNDKLLLSTPSDLPQGSDQDTQGDIGIEYSTHRLLAVIERDLGERWSLRMVPSIGTDFTRTAVGEEFQFDQDQWVATVRVEAPWSPSPELMVAPGVDFLAGWGGFEARFPLNPNSLVGFDPLAEREPWAITGDSFAASPDPYLKALWRPVDGDPERLLVSAGLRGNVVWVQEEYFNVTADPRLALRARLVGEKGFVKTGFGLYQQPPQTFELYNPAEGVGVTLDMERAWSATLGWEQGVGVANHIDAEVFYKYLDRLIVDNPDLVDLATDSFFSNEGVGQVMGLEVIARHEPVDRWFGWISYTLSRSMRNDHPERDGADWWYGCSETPEDPEDLCGWYRFDFDQRHILVALAGYEFPFQIRASAKVQHVTGNPYSPLDTGVYDIDQDTYDGFATGERNSEQLPPFTALDLRVERRFLFKRGRLDLYADLLNVYRGENPEFVSYNYDYTESRYIRGLPFIPSLGFELEFKL